MTKNTRELILDVAEKLFESKGFDNTSISEIQNQVQIARGTLYYHFNSKEEIMHEIIDRKTGQMIEKAREPASNKNIPALERLKNTLGALNNYDDRNVTEYLHEPQNAVMHEKVNRIILKDVTPIISEIVEDGITEGVFSTDFPFEATEMLVLYANTTFDSTFSLLSDDEKEKKIRAFYYNASLLLGMKSDVSEILSL